MITQRTVSTLRAAMNAGVVMLSHQTSALPQAAIERKPSPRSTKIEVATVA
jgi:hypothetical protein